jgi:hypothetical protein
MEGLIHSYTWISSVESGLSISILRKLAGCPLLLVPSAKGRLAFPLRTHVLRLVS